MQAGLLALAVSNALFWQGKRGWLTGAFDTALTCAFSMHVAGKPYFASEHFCIEGHPACLGMRNSQSFRWPQPATPQAPPPAAHPPLVPALACPCIPDGRNPRFSTPHSTAPPLHVNAATRVTPPIMAEQEEQRKNPRESVLNHAMSQLNSTQKDAHHTGGAAHFTAWMSRLATTARPFLPAAQPT